MRLLFVVQRYGREVAGGAELSCRQFATHLAERGHDVEALTSCAISYVDWANEYPPGTEILDGVVVHRLPVRRPREHRFFGAVDFRAVWQYRPSSLVLQEAWMQAQGPDLPDLAGWLKERAAHYDVVVFFTYLYYTAWRGLSAVDRSVPTILHATAHDEPPLWLQVFDQMLTLPTAYAYFTEEERALINRRTHRERPGRIVGIGTDLDVAGDGGRFRKSMGLGDRPYLLYVGRVDPAKGSVELYEQFLAYKSRHSGGLALVIVGDPVSPLDPHPDIVMAGYVDDQTKADAIAGPTSRASRWSWSRPGPKVDQPSCRGGATSSRARPPGAAAPSPTATSPSSRPRSTCWRKTLSWSPGWARRGGTTCAGTTPGTPSWIATKHFCGRLLRSTAIRCTRRPRWWRPGL
jgi:glycosyltransferase involved in cell wall biosynthesis